MDEKEALLSDRNRSQLDSTYDGTVQKSDCCLETQKSEENEDSKPSVRSGKLRWLMLVFGCFFLMGNYFCYDNPATLSIFLTDPNGKYNLTNAQVALFYSIYSLPNMVLPLFGGVMIDKIGIKLSLMIFTTIVTIGQMVFAIGGSSDSFALMMVGRFIFGLGGECMTVAQSAIVSQWFKGKELAFAFGLTLSVSRLGSVINGIVEPRIASTAGGVPEGLWIGFAICLFSWVCGLILCLVDRYADQKDGKKAELQEEDKFRWKQICEFSLPFWLIVVSCVSVYCSIFPYAQFTSGMLMKEFDVPKITASSLYSLPFFISAGCSPFLGLLIDKIGKRALFITSSSLFVFFSCILTIVLIEQNYKTEHYTFLAPMIMMGFAYSIYAGALWSSIPYVVKANTIGTAFGLCTAIQNIGLTILPFAVGKSIHKDNTVHSHYGYVVEQMILASLALVGFAFNIWLYCDDIHKRNGQLDKGPAAKDEEPAEGTVPLEPAAGQIQRDTNNEPETEGTFRPPNAIN